MATPERITVDDLRFYIPMFHEADDSVANMVHHSGRLGDFDVVRFDNAATTRDLVVARVATLMSPLIHKVIHTYISHSLFKNAPREEQDEVENILMRTGVNEGLIRGMRKYDVSKSKGSPTNYLMMWVSSYVKRELLRLEAPPGVPPSRFALWKKVSAVRKKLTETCGQPPTDEEILEYFRQGKADIATMSGSKKSPKKFRTNHAMTMAIIAEQGEYERTMMSAPCDTEDRDTMRWMACRDTAPFDETFLGLFLDSLHDVNPSARAVLKAELSCDDHDTLQRVKSMSCTDYEHWLNLWRSLLRDPDGPFAHFVDAQGSAFGYTINMFPAREHIQSYDDVFLHQDTSSPSPVTTHTTPDHTTSSANA